MIRISIRILTRAEAWIRKRPCLPAFLIVGTILVMTLMPGQDANAIVPGGRSAQEGLHGNISYAEVFWKSGHVIAYLLLTLALSYWGKYANNIWSKGLAYCALGSLILAVSSEPLQSIISGRYPRRTDVILDAFGIVLGTSLAWLLFIDGGKLRQRLKRRPKLRRYCRARPARTDQHQTCTPSKRRKR